MISRGAAVEGRTESAAVGAVPGSLGRNSAGIALARAASALTAILAVPFIVNELGFARFGLWESLVACASLTSLVTDPASGTLLWRMSLAWGAGDRGALRRLLIFGLLGALALPVILLPAGLALKGHVAAFLGVRDGNAAAIERLFVVLVALGGLAAINGALGAFNAATQRARVTSGAQTVGQIATYVVAIAGLRRGLDLTAMLLGVGVGQATTALLLAAGALARSSLPTGEANRRPVARMSTARYFGILSVGSASGFLRGQTDRLVLAGLASPSWAGYYGIAARLANLLMEVSNLLYVPTMAAAGALVGARSWGGVRRLYQSTMAVVTLMASCVGALLFASAEPLLRLWIGRPVPEATMILRILIVGTVTAVTITGPGTAICKGIGRPDIELRYVIASLCLNLAMTLLFVALIGPIGSVVASSLSWVVGCIYFASIVSKETRLPRVPVRRASLTLLAAGPAAILGSLFAALVGPAHTRVELFLLISAVSLLTSGSILLLSGLLGGLGYREIARWVRMSSQEKSRTGQRCDGADPRQPCAPASCNSPTRDSAHADEPR